MADKDLLMAYSVMDQMYLNGLVKQIRGDPAAASYEHTSIGANSKGATRGRLI